MIEAIVSRRPLVYLAVVVIIIFGVGTYMSLPREANPDVQIPVITVTTPYIGVSPADIETLVTVPLENELAGVKDLKRMTSTSYEGLSVIMLELEPEVVIQDAMQRVRDRVSRARPDLPDDAEETDIAEINFGEFPILLATLGGPIDEVELKSLGEHLEDEIRRIPGVLEASLSGGREREIRIEADPHRLAHYGLSLSDIVSAVAEENVNIPGGDVRAGTRTCCCACPVR